MQSVEARQRAFERRSSREIDAAGLPTRQLGPYRLCLKLASGGMGTVYLARTPGLNGFVALKVIHPHLVDDRGFLEMFLDEAEVASRVRHGNVCTVFDYDARDGQYYLAMEYLVGESLATLWRKTARRRELDPAAFAARVARVLADACEGLHAAHELSSNDGEPLELVHRDVSPENVFVTYEGVTKIVDFGLARIAGQHHRTRTGMLKGKVAYIAPELLNGVEADRRADVWGIGVTAWELLTGRRLFRTASDLDTLRAVAEETIPTVSSVQSRLPPEFDAVIARALARDPAERYATARDFGRDLGRLALDDGAMIVTADIADWLDELVPGGRQRRQHMIELASQIEAHASDPPTAGARRSSQPPPPSDGDSEQELKTWLVAPQALAPRPTLPPPLPPSASTASAERSAEDARPVTTTRSASGPSARLAVVAGALCVGAAVGAAVAVGLGWGGPAGAAAAEPARGAEASSTERFTPPAPSEPPRDSSPGRRSPQSDATAEPTVRLVRIDRGAREVVLRIQLDQDAPPPAPAELAAPSDEAVGLYAEPAR